MNHLTIHTIITVVCLLIYSTAGNSQNRTYSGRILNAETNEPIQFANIGIEDTYLGTASGVDGEFELSISNSYMDKVVRISAVGFQTKSLKISELGNGGFHEIKLAPVNYGISEVSVKAKSKIAYGLIKTASHLIKENYLSKPFTYHCYLKTNSLFTNENVISQSIINLSDKNGYNERTFTDAFTSRNYSIEENETNVDINSIRNGLAYVDFIIDHDLVRCPGNILSISSLNDFNIDIIRTDVLNKDSVWVIKYECNNPTMQNCGDPEAIKFSGKLWLNMRNQAILKNSSIIVREGEFIHGNSFCNPEKNKRDHVEYKVETEYNLRGSRYTLKSIDYLQKKENESQYTLKLYLQVLDVLPFDNKINDRQYLGVNKSDSKFWETFKIP